MLWRKTIILRILAQSHTRNNHVQILPWHNKLDLLHSFQHKLFKGVGIIQIGGTKGHIPSVPSSDSEPCSFIRIPQCLSNESHLSLSGGFWWVAARHEWDIMASCPYIYPLLAAWKAFPSLIEFFLTLWSFMSSSFLHHPLLCLVFSQPLKIFFLALVLRSTYTVCLSLSLSVVGSHSSCSYPSLDGDNKPFLPHNTRNSRKGRWAAMGEVEGGKLYFSFVF